MELLISAIISIGVEIFKSLVAKFGRKMTENGILIVLFCSSVLVAYLRTQGYVTMELIETASKLLMMAVGIYELIYKRVVIKVFNHFTK